MNENDKEVILNLKVAKATMDILEKRKLGIEARLEGISAYVNHDEIDLSGQVLLYLVAEITDIIDKSKSLLEEYKEFAEWTQANLPEKFHFHYKN